MAVLTLVAMAAAIGLVASTQQPPGDPIADFNHRIHIESELECADCHVGVETAARAGVPSVEICAECHEDPEDSMVRSENGKRILASVLEHEEMWWPSVYWLPDHVVFSHRRHVAIGEIDCKDCHGDMASATTLPSEAVHEILTMDGCLKCHERSGASLDCAACHR